MKLYALPYYATVDTLKTKKDHLAKFLRATGKGWAYAYANRDKAVEHLVKEFPNLVAADEREALEPMLKYAFSPKTASEGWGTMDPAVWEEQIKLYSDLGQFTKRTPKLDEVMTMDLLNATREARLKASA